ncbi:MAG: ABC transporter permease subunit [bacterium]|nr:ABC transporter permease subunit [bacterium]
MYAVFLREVKSYFGSLTAWVLIAVYLLVTGIFSSYGIEGFARWSMTAMQGSESLNINEVLVQNLLSTYGFLLLIFIPMLTMRLFAGERRAGTLDLLLTYPITEMQIILGKLFAALAVVALLLVLTLSSFIIMHRLTPLDWAAVASGYTGLLLLAVCLISMGMWASSLSSSQIVAVSLSFFGGFMIWIFSALDQTGILKERFGDLSALSHLNNLTKGLVDTQDVVYFLAFAALFLFLTARVLESRKWRG